MLRCAAAAAALSAAFGGVRAETPVQKVIALLHKLRDQVQEEGTAEAASYDKFACFCKDQADSKVYAIKKSQSIIEEHTAAIEALGTEISQLDQDVIDHKSDISDEETEAETKNADRQKTLDTYIVERKNLTEGIDAITRAIETLRENRDSVEAVKAAAALVETQSAMLVTKQSGRFLSQQAPKNYEYRSSEVLQTLVELSKTFKQKLVELDEEEARDRQQHEMTEGARANKISALQASVDKKTTLSAKKSEEKADREGLVEEETNARDADQSFLDELTTTCENKAKSWDARSKARAAELTAMTDAIGTLEGMGDLYNANKKLVGLVATNSQAAVKPHAPALVQISASRSAEKGIESVVGLLQRSAAALNSGSLAALAAKLSEEPGTDHFVKVRSLIKDLIAKLEQEALDEADAKQLCDTQMAAAVKKRDERQSEIEELKAQIKGHESDIAKDTADMANLKEEIADLQKALKEMTDLRNEEKARNEKTIADAKAGGEAISQALVVLRDYYGSQAGLLQLRGAYVPPNSDREGKTVSDLAPESESFSGEYKGKAAESKGVIGLLEVIQSDFERTVTTTEDYEKEQAANFVTESQGVEQSISLKDEEYLQIKGHKEKAEADLTFAQDNLRDAEKLHDDALEALEKLTASCVDSSESYEERRKRRQEEIEALRQALNILEDWKGF